VKLRRFKESTVAVMDSLDPFAVVGQSLAVEELDRLRGFRGALYRCLTRRADELFELADALLCADGPVQSLVGLCLAPEHRRGHGALYDALNCGEVDADRLRERLAALPVPRMFGGRIVLAVDVSPWLRPDAPTCPDRLFCHVYGRGRARDADQRIPGWPYQVVAALESGPTSWTAMLDAVRLGPADDPTAVTAAQLRAIVARLRTAGHWRPGDPAIMVMLDSGYDVTRLAFVLADLPIHLVGRIRADRVMLAATPPRPAGGPGPMGRPRRHGAVMTLADPGSWPTPTTTTTTETARYGKAQASSWDRMHPRLASRGPWADHVGRLPIVEGTVIRLAVEHLPGQREAKPVWLWSSTTGADAAQVIRCWQAYLRRFDLEHTFRLFKQTLGWTTPKLRSPAAADRWTWLVIAAHTQLRLARGLAVDLRRPWERPLAPERLTPARVRRGFRYLRAKTTQPASAPKPTHPGPGRPPGVKNRRTATHHDVGKTVTRDSAGSGGQQIRG
jgi:DDE superfamily endonuclease